MRNAPSAAFCWACGHVRYVALSPMPAARMAVKEAGPASAGALTNVKVIAKMARAAQETVRMTAALLWNYMPMGQMYAKGTAGVQWQPHKQCKRVPTPANRAGQGFDIHDLLSGIG